MRVMTREFSRQSDSRNPVSGLLFPSVVRDSIFDRAKTRLNGRGGKGGRRTRKQGTRVYSATPLDTDGMFQQRGGGSYGKWRAASGGQKLFYLVRNSPPEDAPSGFVAPLHLMRIPLNIQKHRDARFYIHKSRFPFVLFEREREKKENKKEQKGGEELGRLINFLITISSTDSLSFFFFVSSCYYIPWTSKKKEEKRAEY